MRKYRVWTKDAREKYTCHTDWTTRGQCRKYILGRWVNFPPWAFISSAKSQAAFIRANGR